MPRHQDNIAPDAKLMQLDDAAALIGAGGRRYVVWLLRHHYLTAVMFKSVRLVSRSSVEAFCRDAERWGRLPDEDFVWPKSRDPRLSTNNNAEGRQAETSPLRLLSTEPCKTSQKTSQKTTKASSRSTTSQNPQDHRDQLSKTPAGKRRETKGMQLLRKVISS